MDALLLVDIQVDFLPGGALPVTDGDAVVPVANALQPLFPLVIASQDWHPRDHVSFAVNHPGKRPGDVVVVDGVEQVLWPVHCVQHTPGAAFAPGLKTERIAHVVHKGTDPRIDSYSAFHDNARRRDTGLRSWLRARGVDALYVLGLATDYCVQFTVLDALDAGFATTLVADGCRGVDRKPGDVTAAIARMREAGARIATSAEVAAARR